MYFIYFRRRVLYGITNIAFFRTVAEEGSYSAAAEKLNYAQSNLSSRIIQLEKECGALLFQRHKNGITLTGKGSLLLDYAVQILDISNEMEKAVRDDVRNLDHRLYGVNILLHLHTA